MGAGETVGPRALAIPSLLLLGLFAACGILWVAGSPLYFQLLGLFRFGTWLEPFLDTHFITAQIECARLGMDVYVVNACDPLGRLHDYSPIWLAIPLVGTGEGWIYCYGVLLNLGFIAALYCLPRPPANLRNLLLTMLATVSPPTLFAMERGNSDLLIFAMIVAAAWLIARSPRLALAGYAVVFVAALLKFYPLVAMATVLRERAGRALAISGAVLLGTGLFVAAFSGELAKLHGNILTGGYFGNMFGMPVLTQGLHELYWRFSPSMLALALLSITAARAVSLSRGDAIRGAVAGLSAMHAALLLAGSLLVCGIFVAHENIEYRAIMLLLVLPGLLQIGTKTAGAGWRLAAPVLAGLMWSHTIRAGIGGGIAGAWWFLEQFAWWWLIGRLGAILLRIALDSPLWRAATRFRLPAANPLPADRQPT